jgi:hypothetical protein
VNEEAMAHGAVAPITKRRVTTEHNKRAAVMCRVSDCLKLGRLPIYLNNTNKQQKSSESRMFENTEEFRIRSELQIMHISQPTRCVRSAKSIQI